MDYRLKEMQEMKLAGASYQGIADKFGISRQRVQQIMAPSPEVAQSVKTRAGGKCQRCGEYVGVSGHIHHNGSNARDYDSIDNLEYLCLPCHRKAHKNTISDETRARMSRASIEGRYRKYMATGEL